MRRLQPLGITAALAALIVALPALGQEANGGTPGLEPLLGTWHYAGTPEEGTQIIHRAVDETVAPISFVTRPFVAGKLREKNPLVERIDISAPDQDEVQIVFDGERTYQTPLGEWRRHTFGGEDINVQIRHRGNALIQFFRSESGLRRNVYRHTGQDQMRLEVTIQSDRIPEDMQYQLNYRRR